MNNELIARCYEASNEASKRRDWYRVYQIANAIRFLHRCRCRVKTINMDAFPRTI